jgi:hypothetical protein
MNHGILFVVVVNCLADGCDHVETSEENNVGGYI